jgi:hypothetical protein
MNTIKTRLSILVALLIIGYFVWQLTRPNVSTATKDSIKAAAPIDLLTTVESGLESGGLAVLELFQGQELDAASTYLSYLSGDFTPKYKTDLATMPGPSNTQKSEPMVSITAAVRALIDTTVELAPVDPNAGVNTVLALDADGRGLILLPVGPENAAKRQQKSQFKIVIPLAGIVGKFSLWHAETDSYLACGANGRVVMIPSAGVVGSQMAMQAASFSVVSSDGFTVCLVSSQGPIGFPAANKRMEVIPGGREGITRFELRDPVDGRNLLSGAGLEGFDVDASEDSSREVRDKRWVTEQVKSGMLCEDELDIDIETFQDVKQAGFQDVPKVATKPSEMVLNAAVDKALDDVFQANTGKVFSDMMTMDKKDRESQLDNQVFQRLEKAKMDPGIKSILDYNEARYDIYRDENARYQTKIENQTVENTKRLDQMINDLDKYKIQKLAQEYYYLKMIRDESKGRTLPKQTASGK